MPDSGADFVSAELPLEDYVHNVVAGGGNGAVVAAAVALGEAAAYHEFMRRVGLVLAGHNEARKGFVQSIPRLNNEGVVALAGIMLRSTLADDCPADARLAAVVAALPDAAVARFASEVREHYAEVEAEVAAAPSAEERLEAARREFTTRVEAILQGDNRVFQELVRGRLSSDSTAEIVELVVWVLEANFGGRRADLSGTVRTIPAGGESEERFVRAVREDFVAVQERMIAAAAAEPAAAAPSEELDDVQPEPLQHDGRGAPPPGGGGCGPCAVM